MAQLASTHDSPSSTRVVRVLLVRPASLCNVLTPPIGLLYLSSSLKAAMPGAEVRLLDLRLERAPDRLFEKTVAEWRPDLLGISVYTGELEHVRGLVAAARRIQPEIHICFGGPGATIGPEDFDALSEIDSMVAGEGETAFARLAASIADGAAPAPGEISGLSVRDSSGEFVRAGKAEPIVDLDNLPFPDWDIIDIDRYAGMPQMNGFLAGKKYFPIFTSRACPFKCIYCHDIFGKQPRLRSAENVVDEIAALRGMGVDEIQIIDDCFNVNKQRLLKICRLIEQRGIKVKISFPNGLRSDIMDEEMLVALKRAGAWSVTFAVESASPRIQKLTRRNLNLERTYNAIRTAHRLGFITRAFFMIGFPTETLDEIKATIRIAMKLPLHGVAFSIVIPFKGAEMYEIACRELGKEKVDTVITPSYTSDVSFYELLTGIDLRRIQSRAYMRFYFNPVRALKLFVRVPRKIAYLNHIRRNIRIVWSLPAPRA